MTMHRLTAGAGYRYLLRHIATGDCQRTFGHRPTILLVRVRRYRCGPCRRVWRQDMSKAAEPRSKLSRGGLAWAGTRRTPRSWPRATGC